MARTQFPMSSCNARLNGAFSPLRFIRAGAAARLQADAVPFLLTLSPSPEVAEANGVSGDGPARSCFVGGVAR